MAESKLHIELKGHADTYLRTHMGCGVVLTEATINGWFKGLPVRPDILGFATHHPELPYGTSIEVEVEPDIPGIRAEMHKAYRNGTGIGVGQIRYLMHPDNIEPDRHELRIPTTMGLLSCSPDGVVREYDVQGVRAGHRITHDVALLVKVIEDYQRQTGKRAGTVRSSQRGRLTREQNAGLISVLHRHREDPFPEVHVSYTATLIGMKPSVLRDLLTMGVEGVIYDITTDTIIKSP